MRRIILPPQDVLANPARGLDRQSAVGSVVLVGDEGPTEDGSTASIQLNLRVKSPQSDPGVGRAELPIDPPTTPVAVRAPVRHARPTLVAPKLRRRSQPRGPLAGRPYKDLTR